jgi:hypothetical protein
MLLFRKLVAPFNDAPAAARQPRHSTERSLTRHHLRPQANQFFRTDRQLPRKLPGVAIQRNVSVALKSTIDRAPAI